MTSPCPHCGAVPSGVLMGFPIVMHKADCHDCPKPIPASGIAYVMAQLLPEKRFMCAGCGVQWDEPGEAEYKHAQNCRFNPLRN